MFLSLAKFHYIVLKINEIINLLHTYDLPLVSIYVMMCAFFLRRRASSLLLPRNNSKISEGIFTKFAISFSKLS